MQPKLDEFMFPPARLGLRGEVDGWRILVYKDGTGVRLLGRNGYQPRAPLP
jgi:hypothetical protein